VPWIIATAALAVVLLIVILFAVRQRRLNQELATERDDARQTTTHLETRVATLRHELSEQHRANAELTAQLRSAGDARSGGLWALERLRQSRLAGTPTLPTSGPGISIGMDLQAAVALELELLREEVGTYAEVTGFELSDPVSPREALAVLRVVQELTAALAKRSDELKITIVREDDTALVTIQAAGWAEAAPNHTMLERCVSALDGTIVLRPEAGVLTAEVRIPDRTS